MIYCMHVYGAKNSDCQIKKKSPIPTESQFAKFNAHQIFRLHGITMIESMQPSRTII